MEEPGRAAVRSAVLALTDMPLPPGLVDQADPDRAIKFAHVAVYGTEDERAVGGGLLFADRLVVTCAHVVNRALGRHVFAPEPPGAADAPLAGIGVALPGLGKRQRVPVAVQAWVPAGHSSGRPAREGDVEWTGDLAVLRLLGESPLRPAAPVSVGSAVLGAETHVWYGSGAPTSVASAVVRARAQHWLILDSSGRAQEIVEGFSGSPLWDRSRQQVVGMVVGRRGARAFAIPGEVLAAALTSAASSGRPDLESTGLTQVLTAAVRSCLPTRGRREECAQDLARELNLPEFPPAQVATDLWLARAALSAPHGVPTLLSLLEDGSASAEDRELIRRVGLQAAPSQFLTAAEHQDLLGLLAVPLPAPDRIVARAFPGAAVAGMDWEAAVAELERYRPRYGRVPQLLRVVEFLSWQVEPRILTDALCAWNDAVARRLGVAEGLLEHRAQAREFAERLGASGSRPTRAVRARIHLWRAAGSDTFTFEAEVRDGSGVVVRRRAVDAPARVEELGPQLFEVLTTAAGMSAPGSVPWVEWVLQPEEIDLPVETWVYDPQEALPGVVGEDFVSVTRCPRLRRPDYLPEWQHRWAALDTGEAMVVEEPNARLRDRGSARPVVAAVLCCPPEDRAALRAAALAFGTPGVVWIRPSGDATYAELADRLRRLARLSSPAEIPHAVFAERRLRTTGGPGRHSRPGSHIGIVWDGPVEADRDLLTLSDPSFAEW